MSHNLSIHGVDRLFERTRLTLSELRAVIREEAFVPLGYDGETEYLLFYDYRGSRVKIICARESTVVTILEQSHCVPDHIREKITKETRREARLLPMHKIKGLKYALNSPLVPGLLDVTLLIYADNLEKKLLYQEILSTVLTDGYNEVKSDDIVEHFFARVMQIISGLGCSQHTLHSMRLKIELRHHEHGKVYTRIKFDFWRLIRLSLKNGSQLDGVLEVRTPEESITVLVGTLPWDKAVGDRIAIRSYMSTFNTIVSALSQRWSPAQLSRVAYRLVLTDAHTGIIVRTVTRSHHQLAIELYAWNTDN